MSKQNSSFDFRRSMIRDRLRNVRKLLLVVSGKGGVGKSIVSATTAALLADAGFGVGLMDADIYGPSSALLFDAHSRPKEGKRGLIPPVKSGVKIMSVDLFAPGRPFPLIGFGAIQIILEMLALTDWGKLDYLVVDMPPATSDIMMTLTSLGSKELGALVVTMPDRLSLAVSHRTLQLLHTGNIPIAGVLGNMHRHADRDGIVDDDGPRRLAKEFNVAFLGKLPYDAGVQIAVEDGNIRGLLGTRFAMILCRSLNEYLKLSKVANK